LKFLQPIPHPFIIDYLSDPCNADVLMFEYSVLGAWMYVLFGVFCVYTGLILSQFSIQAVLPNV